jgi:16S rRNA (adenine1518-N6/adenine1519-N6)-dimethyltransferase
MKAKKHFGQHFLTAPAYARRIAEAVPAQRLDAVLEIGPGTGALTRFLVQRFDALHCVERDADVLPKLKERVEANPPTIHLMDALDFDFSQAGFPLHAVGNLPYSVGALLIKKTLLHGNQIVSVTFMVQREVAERICAAPGTKLNGFLSIFCQFFGPARILFHVPPGAFFPRPNVDSSVFQIIIRPELTQQLPRDHWEPFFALVSHGFSMRRKKLSTVLTKSFSGIDFVAILDTLALDANARAEQLDCAKWLQLYRLAYGL